MKINIYGSTGVIGNNTLKIIFKNFNEYKINLLVAKSNVKKILYQVKKYKPKFVYLDDELSNQELNFQIKKNKYNTKVLQKKNMKLELSKRYINASIFSISGLDSLKYLNLIIGKTKYLGFVNKESIVSAGHLFTKMNKNQYTKIFPLDSEHFSLLNFFENNNSNQIKKIYLTASGGPFLDTPIHQLKKATFIKAKNHPKWKMGYKNSIDSATLSNKCLELIEAHYLFNIPKKKLDVIIHPEALIHSIIELKNNTSIFNYFTNDMSIPISNFLNFCLNNKYDIYKKNNFYNINLNFLPVDKKKFPIYSFFFNHIKNDTFKIIKFNLANQFAVELFKNGKISYTEISQIIKKSLQIKLYCNINSLKDIILFNKTYFDKLDEKFNNN